jgi:hypothetical protein
MNLPIQATGTDRSSEAQRLPANAAPTAYEPPCLTPVGNLSDLLGKSGAATDYTYRRHNNGRP